MPLKPCVIVLKTTHKYTQVLPALLAKEHRTGHQRTLKKILGGKQRPCHGSAERRGFENVILHTAKNDLSFSFFTYTWGCLIIQHFKNELQLNYKESLVLPVVQNTMVTSCMQKDNSTETKMERLMC